MNWRVLGVGLCFLVACSSSPSSSSSEDPAAPATDAGGAVEGGPAGRDAEAPTDGSVALDGATDAGADGGTAKRCGHGTFTQAEAIVACEAPNLYLDSGPGAQPRYCDGATISGGSWEVWCSSGPLLVKLHLDGLTATTARSGCMGFTETKVASGWSQLNGSGSGMLPKSGAPVAFDVTKPIAIDLATLGNSTSDKTGTGQLYLIGEFPGPCGGQRPRAVMSGVAISWNATTGN
jgi:hypothetical protein